MPGNSSTGNRAGLGPCHYDYWQNRKGSGEQASQEGCWDRNRGTSAKGKMYLYQWNSEANTLEASLGGYVTLDEVEVLFELIQAELASNGQGEFGFQIDTTRLGRTEYGVDDFIASMCSAAEFAGATHVEWISEDDFEATLDPRIIRIMNGEDNMIDIDFQVAKAA